MNEYFINNPSSSKSAAVTEVVGEAKTMLKCKWDVIKVAWNEDMKEKTKRE